MPSPTSRASGDFLAPLQSNWGYNVDAFGRGLHNHNEEDSQVRKRLRTLAGGILLGLCLPLAASAAPLNVGDKAPDFTLPDQNGKQLKLADYLGKKNVVLAFYVFAFTGG